jgi:Glycosyl transferases group 1
MPEAGGTTGEIQDAETSPPPDDEAAQGLDGDADERAWWRAELSLVVRSRRQSDDDLDRAKRDLAAARVESAALNARRSVRLALAVSDALRPLRSAMRRRPRAPTATAPTARVASSTGDAQPLTPAEFRARLTDRLARPDNLKVARVDRADPTRPVQRDDDLHGADIVVVSTPDFDVRTPRRGGVSVALVGPDVGAWLDRPWLDDFDIVATANPASVDAILAGRAKRPVLLADPPAEIEATVLRWVDARRVGIAVGIPSWDEGAAWGDLHFARAVQRQFELAGYPARLQIRPEWTDGVSARDDVSLHLFGLAGRRRLPGQLTLLWIISHPERVSDELIAGADRIYVASDQFAREVAGRTTVPVAPLHQATDALRFRPDPSGPDHEVLFVGNSRGVRREIVADLVPTTLGLAVYGQWPADRLDPAYHMGEFIPNEDLHRYYSSASIVLNDHWPDMRAAGFFSNRLYDALASGACVVSDYVPGIEEEFDGAVATYSDAGDLRLLLRDLLRHPARRWALAERGRAAVLDRHTFEHRTAAIVADVVADLS